MIPQRVSALLVITAHTCSGALSQVTDAAGTRTFAYDARWLPLVEFSADPNDPNNPAGIRIERKYTWGLDVADQARAGSAGLGGTGVSPVSIGSAAGIGGLLACSDPNDPDDPDDSFGDYLYFYDGGGNVGQLIDSASPADAATIAARYEYDPFGKPLLDVTDPAASGPYAAHNPFRFSTKFHDDETGLHASIFRYYDPRLGRWSNRDPIGDIGGMNLYGLRYNSPPNYADPFGLSDIEFHTSPGGGETIICRDGNDTFYLGFVDPDNEDFAILPSEEGPRRISLELVEEAAADPGSWWKLWYDQLDSTEEWHTWATGKGEPWPVNTSCACPPGSGIKSNAYRKRRDIAELTGESFSGQEAADIERATQLIHEMGDTLKDAYTPALGVASIKAGKCAGTVVRGAKVAQEARAASKAAKFIQSTRSSPGKLGRNLVKAGHCKPPGAAVHHIVPGDMKRAEEARDILTKWEIDLNAAENGVWLPHKASSKARGAYHRRVHTNAYIDELTERLKRADSQQAALKALEDIRKKLLKGTCPP